LHLRKLCAIRTAVLTVGSLGRFGSAAASTQLLCWSLQQRRRGERARQPGEV